jgi:hypothetical protein
MYQIEATGDQPVSARPKNSKLRPTLSNPNLPVIEEKDGDVDLLDNLSPDVSSKGVPPLTPLEKEKQMRFAETPSSDGPVSDREVILDKFGFPLFPQPLDDDKDPLTWSKATKIRILVQISLVSFLSLFTAFAIVCRPVRLSCTKTNTNSHLLYGHSPNSSTSLLSRQDTSSVHTCSLWELHHSSGTRYHTPSADAQCI